MTVLCRNMDADLLPFLPVFLYPPVSVECVKACLRRDNFITVSKAYTHFTVIAMIITQQGHLI